MGSNDEVATVSSLQEAGALLVEDGNHGEYRPRRDEFVVDGVAFVRAADISGGFVDFERADAIDEVALERLRKGIGLPGDILLTHKGTVGRVARVPNDAPPFVCSPQTTFWRILDPNRLDPGFSYTGTFALPRSLDSYARDSTIRTWRHT